MLLQNMACTVFHCGWSNVTNLQYMASNWVDKCCNCATYDALCFTVVGHMLHFLQCYMHSVVNWFGPP